MNSYGWKVKSWNFNENNLHTQLKNMIEWCDKFSHKYQIREIFTNNAFSVEYRLKLKY